MKWLNYLGIYTFKDCIKRENEMYEALIAENERLKKELNDIKYKIYNHPEYLLRGLVLNKKQIDEIRELCDVAEMIIPK